MKVGLFGLNIVSGNMGCQALAYSFLHLLNRVKNDREIECYLFLENDSLEEDIEEYEELKIKPVLFRMKDRQSMKRLKRYIKECDVVFDFTEGDSFSDIYGLGRMLKVSLTKLMVIHTKRKLVLAPQTYGPYQKSISKKIAKHILKRSFSVCTRDEKSKGVVKEIAGMEIEALTDVAFVLPYHKEEKSECKKIGINVSGLLWSGGYNGQNQFGLKVNYQEYIKQIISRLLEQGFEVHLIPHVITKNPNSVENDVTASKEVKEIFQNVVIAPSFTNPMEAKSYIAKMDLFIGARMHATIGALSAGVPTIPFSYSRKFEGLFGTLNYPYTIQATSIDTDIAIEKTMNYIENKNSVKEKVEDSLELIKEKTDALEQWCKKILDAVS